MQHYHLSPVSPDSRFMSTLTDIIERETHNTKSMTSLAIRIPKVDIQTPASDCNTVVTWGQSSDISCDISYKTIYSPFMMILSSIKIFVPPAPKPVKELTR